MTSFYSWMARAAVGFAVLLLLSLGLCGAAVALGNKGLAGTLAGASLFGMALGALGLVAVGVVTVIGAIVGLVRGKDQPPPPSLQ